MTDTVEKPKKRMTHLQDIWESYEHLLRDDLERLDIRMYKINQEARSFNVPQDKITKFINEHMAVLINETVERRKEHVKKHGGMKLC